MDVVGVFVVVVVEFGDCFYDVLLYVGFDVEFVGECVRYGYWVYVGLDCYFFYGGVVCVFVYIVFWGVVLMI